MVERTVERTGTGGIDLPLEVLSLCEKEKISVHDVVVYRIGARQPWPVVNGRRPLWVVPVAVVLSDGRKYTGEVVWFNDADEVSASQQQAGSDARRSADQVDASKKPSPRKGR